MPEILVSRQPEDEIYDRNLVDGDELGDRIEEVYEKLDSSYTFEVLPDGSPRTQNRE